LLFALLFPLGYICHYNDLMCVIEWRCSTHAYELQHVFLYLQFSASYLYICCHFFFFFFFFCNMVDTGKVDMVMNVVERPSGGFSAGGGISSG
jgi:hypothetical protein